MKTVIIDDEKDAIYTLDLIIQEYLPELKVIGKFTNPGKALKEIPALMPDLIFLDINMPGMDGFELLQKLENTKYHVIFTTACDEYALKAFKFNAVDYLLKPINIIELTDTVARLVAKVSTNSIEKFAYRKLIDEINTGKYQKISLPTADGIYFLKPSEIIYFLACGSNTKVIRKDGDIIFVSKTLKELETIMGAYFFRIHNSYIINLKYIKMLIKGDGWGLIMENDDKLPIARRKRADLNNLIARIAGNYLE